MKRPLQALGPAVTVVCAALTGACSGFLKSTTQPEQVYYIRAPAEGGGEPAGPPSAAAQPGGAAQPGSGVSLRVGHPLAAPGLESSHIMLVQADHRMNFYAGSRWPAPLASLVEALAVETLRGSGVWSSVEDSTSPFPSDYLLQIAVRRFESDYTQGAAPEVHVVFDCIIGRREGREVVASFVAAGSARPTANRVSEIVSAYEQAAGTALGALSREAAQAVRAARTAAQNAERPDASISRANQ